MTTQQQEILETFDNSTLCYFLRKVRNKAFIIWGTEDVIQKAYEIGFTMQENEAIDIIADIDRQSDCEHGITWDTLDYHIDKWIEKNSFHLEIEVSDGEKQEVKVCSLKTNINIENFHKDDDYFYYGVDKNKIYENLAKDNVVRIAGVIVLKAID